jgi:thiamine pyrophosphate-dependent acetolactate synthase large subunit-like protein
MALRDALVALRGARHDDDVVVTTMGAARDWMALGAHPLDLVLVPSSMGQATSYGLGLALAQPARRVVVVNGDGSMLMNLGSLVTIADAAPPNLTVIVVDNGVYEVTGAQPVPGAGRVDFAAMARACGLRAVHRYADADAWARDVDAILAAPGPTLVVLDVAGVAGIPGPRSPGPAGERGRRLMDALGVAPPPPA